jgi:hypothetical protein
MLYPFCQRADNMSESQFDIIFRGDIVFGHQLADVKTRLQQLFKADAAKIDALFTGRPVPLKRGLDEASAQKYKEVLIKAGAQVELVAVTAPGITPPPVKPELRSASSITIPAQDAPLTLAQRLALQEAEAAKKAQLESAQKANAEPLKAAVGNAPATGQTGNWSIAPAGADLLAPTERHEFIARDIDTRALSLRAPDGNLVDASEQAHATAVVIKVPDYAVADAGADLLEESERVRLPLPEIELEDWTIAEAGTDLIDESEKDIQPAAVIHIPDVGLAPVGADLGQIRPQIKPVVPDISGIKLADA